MLIIVSLATTLINHYVFDLIIVKNIKGINYK